MILSIKPFGILPKIKDCKECLSLQIVSCLILFYLDVMISNKGKTSGIKDKTGSSVLKSRTTKETQRYTCV